ncbi:MAG: universal stress protein [Bradymonadaceae bacterium]
MKVLIGFDGSLSAWTALERAIALFAAAQPEIVLLGAFVRPMTSEVLAEEAFDAARDEARDELKAAAGVVRDAGLSGRIRFIEGEPRKVLENVTLEEEPDVVVVGARGKGALTKVLLGSVSTYAVKHLPCSVLVVRS